METKSEALEEAVYLIIEIVIMLAAMSVIIAVILSSNNAINLLKSPIEEKTAISTERNYSREELYIEAKKAGATKANGSANIEEILSYYVPCVRVSSYTDGEVTYTECP